ncbi:uncharacterized protein LOC133807288 isoform X2 [Humulus lupulus]|uniref:uncharacterized protein LOC133807288 isoform X2 n=1 Tax=Humulus lupulus TaxID=3486 RepID=UPI002B413D7C|nr:uncharacterized protein LOC133807288 isoform X2 [Humulus lupulus]
MATVPVADHRHLRLDSIPLIDLRLLSQSDLFSLSLTSSTSHPLRRCDDDVLIPKIDRSVFNESAGSRKQTYSRLRLASRNSKLSPSSSAAVVTPPPAEPLDQESFQIIGLLKQLFTDESRGELVSVPIDYNDSVPEPFCDVVQNVPIDVVVDPAIKKRKRGRPRKNAVPELSCKVENGAFGLGDLSLVSPNSLLYSSGGDIRSVSVLSNAELSNAKPGSFSAPVASNKVLEDSAASIVGGQVKRKRGRPRKNEIPYVENAKGGDAAVCDAKARREKKEELVNENWNGNGVNLGALGNAENPFEEELMKRTQGLKTEAELLGFLGGLEGEWGSWRRKKKIVQASEFGNVLPNGWKIMLSLKRREGRVSLFCRRFVSPNGQQFVSYKEVSSYLLSSFGLQDAGHLKPSLADCKIQEDANLLFEDAKNANELISCSRVPSTSTTDDWKQDMLLETRNTWDVPIANVLIRCHHHAMTFDEKNDLVHHLFSSHKDANGCNSVFCEGLIFKNGNYECQFCHKILDEKFCHNDHVATHVKDDVESIEVSQGPTSTTKKSDPSLSGISPTSLQMNESLGIDEEQPPTMPAKDEVSCGEIKEDNVTLTCHSSRCQDSCIQNTDRGEVVSISYEEQVTDHSIDKKDQEYCEKQAIVCHMINDESGRHEEAIKNAVNSNNEDKDIYERSDGMDVVKCIPNGSMEEPKLVIDPQAGLFSSEENICSIDDFEYQQFASGVGNRNGESISDHCGLGNEEECAPVKDENGFLGSVHEKSTELGFCGSLIDEKTHLVGKDVSNASNVSCGTFYESKNIGSSSDCVTSNTDAITIGDRNLESVFGVPPLNEQDFSYAVNTERPSFKMEEPWSERSFQGDVFSAFVDEKNVNKSSIGAVDVTNCKSSEFNLAFDSKGQRVQAQTISCMDQVGNNGRDSRLLSSYEHTFASEDSGACSGKIEKVDQGRDFLQSDLLNQFDYEQPYDGVYNVNNLTSSSMDDSKIKEVKCLSNNEVSHDFGGNYSGVGSNAATITVEGMSSEGYSFGISGSNQTFPITNDVPDIYSGTVKELEPKRDSKIGLIYPSGRDKIHAVGDNLDGGSTGTHWQRPESEDTTKSGNGMPITGSVKQAQTLGDATPEHIWRTNEQIFQSRRLADTLSLSMQMSGPYLNSNVISDKDAYGNLSAEEKFESLSGLEGLGSVSMDQLQFNLVTAQGTRSNESKGFSHTEMNQGFDSSFGLSDEASTFPPKTSSRHQNITVCVWCGEEFYYEGVSSGTELESMGIMCANCQDKFSG